MFFERLADRMSDENDGPSHARKIPRAPGATITAMQEI
jgi:hypothetical protein